jgi:hypothetical protein
VADWVSYFCVKIKSRGVYCGWRSELKSLQGSTFGPMATHNSSKTLSPAPTRSFSRKVPNMEFSGGWFVPSKGLGIRRVLAGALFPSMPLNACSGILPRICCCRAMFAFPYAEKRERKGQTDLSPCVIELSSHVHTECLRTVTFHSKNTCPEGRW